MSDLKQLEDALAHIKRGPAGRDGRDGLDGVNGADGAPGPRGLFGKDGRDGIDGKDGAPGQHGVDGVQGERGPVGPQGLPGINGKDSSVPGPKGPAGPKGDRGLQGEPGDIGPMPRHEWSDTKLKFEIAPGRWGQAVDLQGPAGKASRGQLIPGPQGLAGATGPQGPAGADGGGGGGGSSFPFASATPTLYDTDGDQNITGAAIVGGIITLGTHINDDWSANVPNAAAIIAAAPVKTIGTSWLLLLINESAHTQEFYTNDSSIIGDDGGSFDWLMKPRKSMLGSVTITGANEVTILSMIGGIARPNWFGTFGV